MSEETPWRAVFVTAPCRECGRPIKVERLIPEEMESIRICDECHIDPASNRGRWRQVLSRRRHDAYTRWRELTRWQEIATIAIALVVYAVLLPLVSGCGDNHQVAHLIEPVDAGELADATPADVLQVGCCTSYPDEDAIRLCASMQLAPGACGVFVCPKPPEDGGGNLKINACGPPLPADAGVDAPTDSQGDAP